jgi:hypothetical protein
MEIVVYQNTQRDMINCFGVQVEAHFLHGVYVLHVRSIKCAAP